MKSDGGGCGLLGVVYISLTESVADFLWMCIMLLVCACVSCALTVSVQY